MLALAHFAFAPPIQISGCIFNQQTFMVLEREFTTALICRGEP
jgi:hypothetical protein